ncbi:MAG: organomercurial lyase [Pseudonocardiaceae bacterium]
MAYPFSAAPTRHRVRLATGVDTYAMCVIDALGIPPDRRRVTRPARLRPASHPTTGRQPGHECWHMDIYTFGADGHWRCKWSQVTGIIETVPHPSG